MSAVTAAPRPGLGTLIAAVLLPPLAIFLVRGLGAAFWIGVLATIIGWVPGVLFALVVVLRPDMTGRL
jgi:uncharacterized membrane protein YqaE (UPF0057 family)